MTIEEKRSLCYQLQEQRWEDLPAGQLLEYSLLAKALLDYQHAEQILQLVAKDTLEKLQEDIYL